MIFIYKNIIYIYISAVERLMINRIQNKGFCLHNICVCAVYIYYAYIKNTHTAHILKIFTCIYIYIFIFI